MHHKVRTINIPTTSVPFKQTHKKKPTWERRNMNIFELAAHHCPKEVKPTAGQ